MIIIAGQNHMDLANKVGEQLGSGVIAANVRQFGDQELNVQIEGNLCNQDVVILQSTSTPVNDNLMTLLLMADTAKRAGAKTITAIAPYLGYSRQDKRSPYPHAPIAASLVSRLIEASGIDRLITVDLHSTQSEGFFKIAVQNIDPIPLFSPLFKDIDNAIVVSPDLGGLSRAQRLSVILGVELAFINKFRTQKGDCFMTDIVGSVKNKNCILIDDIIDTGMTLCKAVTLLLEKGAKSVYACVTHAVCSGHCFDWLKNIPIENFYVTDTIQHKFLSDKVKVTSIEKLIINTLKK
jgi:ribose-phosphate pyrophosphokinase